MYIGTLLVLGAFAPPQCRLTPCSAPACKMLKSRAMPSSRHMLLIVMAAVAFVGIVAGLRMQRLAEQSSLASVSWRGSTESSASPLAPKAIDPAFFKRISGIASRVFEADRIYQCFSASLSPAPSAINIIPIDPVSAQAYLVGDVATGKIYLEKNASVVLPAASMSKLLTAITATDMYAPTTTIEITPAEASVASDSSNLMAGERFTASELLYPLLLNSSNVAAEALASSTDRAPFMYLMSGYALEIGMSGSFFADPSGLSEYDRGSVQGFFLLARYLYNSRPDILALARTVSISVATTTDHGAHVFASIHPFVNDPRFLGARLVIRQRRKTLCSLS